jgi:hypothetical protein
MSDERVPGVVGNPGQRCSLAKSTESGSASGALTARSRRQPGRPLRLGAKVTIHVSCDHRVCGVV